MELICAVRIITKLRKQCVADWFLTGFAAKPGGFHFLK